MTGEKIGILGSGEVARQIATTATELGAQVLFFAVSKSHIKSTESPVLPDGAQPDIIDIETPSLEEIKTPVITSTSPPGMRRKLIIMWPGSNYTRVIAESARESIEKGVINIGNGTYMSDGCLIDVDSEYPIKIGKHCFIDSQNSIFRGAQIGNFVTLRKGSIIRDDAEIEDGVFIGQGAVIGDNLRVGRGSIIGKNVVLTKSIGTNNRTVVASNGQLQTAELKNKTWLSKI